MDEINKIVMEYITQGYSCSQIQFLLSSSYHGQENPMLTQALDGLAYGNWQRQTCGCLLGASCVIALYCKTKSREEKHERAALIKELADWFEGEFQSTCCDDLLKEYDENMDRICPRLIGKTFAKTIEILSAQDIDLYNLEI